MSADERGGGLVHLNTPSSIHYTKGQTVSLSDLSRHRTRVECVALPSTVLTPWRQALRLFTKQEGYQPFASDAEAERIGDGPVLPPLTVAAAAAAQNRVVTPFFHLRTTSATAAAASGATGEAKPDSRRETLSSSTPAAAAANAGIAIVTHHKVTGVNEFVYPDYDGVLSGGVVPEVIITEEEKAEKEAARAFYTSPLVMSTEELDAFEELQMLWRSRARSHSALGAHHRQLAGGTLAPGEESEMGDQQGYRGQAQRKRPREGTPDRTAATDTILKEEEARVDDVTDDMLAEALRMADDLLQLS